MYGGCALSTEQSEPLPRAADSRAGWRAFTARLPRMLWGVWCRGARGVGVAGACAVRRRRRDGKSRAPCMIRGVSAAKRAPPWQDLRAMHSRKAICSAFRIHGARILPKPARFGCTAAICCQGGALFPSEAPSGMHEARKLPRMAARERTTAKSYHRQTPGNAFREHPAVAELPRAHRGGVRCHGAGLRGAHHGEILPPSNVGGCSYSLVNPILRFRREIGACSRRPRRAGLPFRAAYAAYGTLSLMTA